MASSQHDEDWQSTKAIVLERSCHMFNNPLMSDIEFTCDGSEKKIVAHKYVLATSSSVFYKMFYGKPPETKPCVHLDDINAEDLEEFIRFIYTDECNLTTDNAMSVLYLATKYIVSSLVQKCIKFLEANLAPENAFTVVQQAIRYIEEELEKKSWDLIELHTYEAVTSDAFTSIDQETLAKLLKRESLNVKEVDLFNAVLKWSEAECSRKGTEANTKNKRTVLGNAIYQIRFASMTLQEFAWNTTDSDLLTADEMIFFYQNFSGVERLSEVWNMSERKAKKETLLRCSRFAGHGSLVFDDCKPLAHAISVSFSKPVKIHGVRLLGEAGKKYDVRLEVYSQIIDNIFRSHEDSPGMSGVDDSPSLSGFDVMLTVPIKVQANVPVPFKATISAKNQVMIYLGSDGQKTVEINGVTIKFLDVPEVKHELTSVERGQFHQIIFSIVN
jgi:hypothetical protein